MVVHVLTFENVLVPGTPERVQEVNDLSPEATLQDKCSLTYSFVTSFYFSHISKKKIK